MRKNGNFNQLRIGAVMSYINMAIGTLIPMFYTPIMLQILGQDEYGLYKLSNSITSYLSLISFGIGSAMVRYFVKYRTEGDKEGEEGLFALFNVIFGIISVIALVSGVVISLNLGLFYSESIGEQLPKMQLLVFLLTINTALSLFCSPYNSVVVSHERFVFLQFINILTTIVSPVVNLIALFMGFASIGLTISSLLISIIVNIVYVTYTRISIKIRPRYYNLPKYLIKEILVFSFWVFVANIVNQLYNTTDTLIIGSIPALATAGVAIYNIGATFNNMMMNFSLGILNVLTPKVNTMVFSHKSNTEITDLMIRIGRLQCYIVSLICFGFISFGRPFIELWAGVGYEEAYWIAIVTMIPACIPLIQNVALSTITAQNKHKFRSIVYLIIAIVNVIGTLICIQYWGIIGAAVVTGVANFIGCTLIMNWYYYKKIGLEIPRFWKSVSNIFIVPISLCIITLLLSMMVDFYNPITMFIGIIVFAIAYFVLSWIFVMTDYEKDIFRGPLKMVVSKFKK